MRLTTVIVAGAILVLTLACSNKKKTTANKTESAERVVVSIPNVFPEEGLTDPHALVENGRLYLFCGHDESWDTDDTWRMNRWEIRSSDNLTDWRKDGKILPTQTYIGDQPNCWAGDIVKKGDKYYWFFSNRHYSTGVMVADSPEGPWVDALGEPLLPEGIIGKTPPYDPALYEENNVYTIFFGSGQYQAATLAPDMISLASEPKPIDVFDKEGKRVWTADKSTVFKHDSIYYLAWGSDYAMSKSLYGPYVYEGAFLAGGHNDVFEWKGQLYAVMENKDISLFYRGVGLKPLNFNEDGTIRIPENDADFPAHGREWNFERSTMGWKAINGTDIEWSADSLIKGEISGDAIIESAPWLLTELKKYQTLNIRIKNGSGAKQARISIASVTPEGAFWKKNTINWEEEDHVVIELDPNAQEFREYTIDLSQLPNLEPMLQKIRIEPAVGVNKGNWEIEYINIH